MKWFTYEKLWVYAVLLILIHAAEAVVNFFLAQPVFYISNAGSLIIAVPLIGIAVRHKDYLYVLPAAALIFSGIYGLTIDGPARYNSAVTGLIVLFLAVREMRDRKRSKTS